MAIQCATCFDDDLGLHAPAMKIRGKWVWGYCPDCYWFRPGDEPALVALEGLDLLAEPSNQSTEQYLSSFP